MQEQTSQPPGGRRQMSVAVAIVLMTVGAILLFALTAGSPHWLNLQVVGVIEPNLLAAYSSNLFGIICVALVKIRHVRGFKRRLILEGQRASPVPAAT